MSLFGDPPASCPVCGSTCIGFDNKTEPFSLRSPVVQSPHQDAGSGEDEEVDTEETQQEPDETRIVATRGRSRRHASDRARRLEADRMRRPEEDR